MAVELKLKSSRSDDTSDTSHVYSPPLDTSSRPNSRVTETTVRLPTSETLAGPVNSEPPGLTQVMSGVARRAEGRVTVQVRE